MLMYKLVSVIALPVLMVVIEGCYRDPKTERDQFITNHHDETFAAFKNKRVFIRGYDHEGSSIVFYSSTAVDALCSRPAIVIVYAAKDEHKALRVDYKLIKPECRKEVEKLEADVKNTVATFINYDITAIRADSAGNVYFRVAPADEIDVMKLSAQKAKDDTNQSLVGYVGVGSGWYKKTN
jgi:hypothetical protein